MATLTLRGVKGTPLTNQEVDDNFTNLNTEKIEIAGDLSGNTTSPIVSGIQGIPVSNTSPSDGQVLIFSTGGLSFSNIPSTNLSVSSSNGSFLEIASSTGTNVSIPLANTTVAGLISSGAQSFAGNKTFVDTITASISGNANTATALQTPRNFTIGNTARSFNGSSNVSWSLSDIGVNNSTLTLSTSGIATGSQSWTSNQGTNTTFTVNVPGTNLGTTANTTTRSVTSSTGDNVVLPSANTTAAGVMSVSDRTKLDDIETGAQVNVPTNLSIGSVSGTSVRVDSSTGTNATIPSANSSSAGLITNSNQDFSGQKTFLDRLEVNNGNYQNHLRLVRSTDSVDISPSTGNFSGVSPELRFSGTIQAYWFEGVVAANNFSGPLTGNASSATKLETARNFTIGETTKSFDGSTNVTWTLEEIGVSGTNLGTTANTTVRTITSSTGDNVVLPSANNTHAGVMSSDDKSKLNGVEAGAEVNVPTNLGTSANNISRTITSSTGDNVVLPSANNTHAGVLSSDTKKKIDDMEIKALSFAIALG